MLAFLRERQARLRMAKVDSGGIGFHLITILHNNGFPAEGLNAASPAQEKERFANLKAERYWHLRERMQRGEISGLSDEALGELAAINYVIDARGKTAIEDKSSVKSALGRSPDIAEALMLALGEPAYEPFRFTRFYCHPEPQCSREGIILAIRKRPTRRRMRSMTQLGNLRPSSPAPSRCAC